MKSTYPFLKTLALLLALVLFQATAPAPGAAEGRFLSAIEDLPLMPGLSEIDGGAMIFDSPSGRIVETLTMGKVAQDKILQFYSETLPQLGWTETATGTFSREGEILKLEFPQTMAISGASPEGEPPMTSVHFMLSPAH